MTLAWIQIERPGAGWNFGPWDPWDSPQAIYAPGDDCIMTSDVIEVNTTSPWMSSASHGANGLLIGPGGTMLDELGSEVANSAYTDGSVLWRSQSQLQQHAASGNNAVWGFW